MTEVDELALTDMDPVNVLTDVLPRVSTESSVTMEPLMALIRAVPVVPSRETCCPTLSGVVLLPISIVLMDFPSPPITGTTLNAENATTLA
ncbi:hypothetical protein [Laribacter hongkongensis]|uniref:hypothetical protein n=2 Tax=Laribacter hongkongensis TaxID=168471 RepID=UPI001EFD64D2|nr:hypothetical protein [Laribacter hongkongensis]MCG9033099.1 hypothetical protein [Laribacter hongkongensis]